MEDLIKALTILLKYGNPKYPTNCSHDELTINSEIWPDMVSEEDKAELEKLGFTLDEYGCFHSFRYGSC